MFQQAIFLTKERMEMIRNVDIVRRSATGEVSV